MVGTKDRPRLTVYRSLKNLYCQLIDDSEGRTLANVSTLSPEIREKLSYGGNKKAAELVGQEIAGIESSRAPQRPGALQHRLHSSMPSRARIPFS